MTHRIAILALPEVASGALMGAIDMFGVANRIASHIAAEPTVLFETIIYSLDGAPVHCSSGQQIVAQGSWNEVASGDIVYLAPIIAAKRSEIQQALLSSGPAISWLRANIPRLKLFMTNCSGTFFLAESGHADDVRVTTAWFLAKSFAKRYSHIALDGEAICTEQGNILCGGATSSYQDICLRVVSLCAGERFARLLAKYLLIDNQRVSQTPYAILSDYEVEDELVSRAEQWIRQHLTESFKVEELAGAMAVSTRTLVRRFKTGINESPQSLTQKLRIEKSKILLETSRLSWAEIVGRCGYTDESAFRRLFKRHCDMSPGAYRQRFNAAFKNQEEVTEV